MVKLSEKKTRCVVAWLLILGWNHDLRFVLHRKIMGQIFLAVEHMHDHNVVHRDLKVGHTHPCSIILVRLYL